MRTHHLFLLFHLFTSFFFFIISSNAQNPNSNPNPNPASAAQGTPPPQDPPSANFQPSLAVVVSLLSIILSLTCFLLLYAKFCHRAYASSGNRPSHEIHGGLLRSGAGLDKMVIESLPFFRFSSLRGFRRGLECAVCLSKFEDIEVLRLLPKCKHAFHIDCIDQWLEKNSTCPLCRRSITADDISSLPYSDSLRFLCLNQQKDLREESGVELYVEREETPHGSSRFCVGSSFRKLIKNDDDASPVRHESLHALSHRIVVSDIIFKSRWSSLSSSDLVFLKSEMLNQVSSSRFSSLADNHRRSIREPKGMMRENEKDHQMIDIKEEMDRKRAFETKVREINGIDDPNSSSSLKSMDAANHEIDKRSMSEIVVQPRFADEMAGRVGSSSSSSSSNAKEEKMRKLWLPIARKTIHWVENRERRPPQSQITTLLNV